MLGRMSSDSLIADTGDAHDLTMIIDCRAVIWDHGNTPTDLNDLKGSFPKMLASAKDINNKGEITGRAIDPNTGALTAYLAVPLSP